MANTKSKMTGSTANKAAKSTNPSKQPFGTYLRRSAMAQMGLPTALVESEQDQPSHIRPKYTTTVTEAPKFELQSYISNYRGRTVFRRLYLISSCSTVLAEEAARLAVKAAQNGKDINAYEDAVQQLSHVTGTLVKDLTDSAWISNQRKRNEGETKRLESELKQYKNNLIRESIRMGSEELGVHYHEIGDLSNALKSFNRMKDYTTMQAHVATTSFRQIAVNIEQKNWMGVQSAVARVGNLPSKPEDAARYGPKIAVAKGLQAMSSGDFKEAANSFLGTDFTLGDTYSDVISSNDVAVYGGLCALASMSRAELQTQVLDNATFRSFLELEPHIRRAINYFCASKYSQCLEILESYRADYLLDIYLQDVLPRLYAKMRSKAIVQYLQPFSRVTLDSMEALFDNRSVTGPQDTQRSASFRDELISMIRSRALNARIDLENNLLIAHQQNQRALMQKEALEKVDKFTHNAQVKLLRLNAINGGLVVKPEQRDKGKGNALDLAHGSDVSNFQGNGFSLRAHA